MDGGRPGSGRRTCRRKDAVGGLGCADGRSASSASVGRSGRRAIGGGVGRDVREAGMLLLLDPVVGRAASVVDGVVGADARRGASDGGCLRRRRGGRSGRRAIGVGLAGGRRCGGWQAVQTKRRKGALAEGSADGPRRSIWSCACRRAGRGRRSGRGYYSGVNSNSGDIVHGPGNILYDRDCSDEDGMW